MERLSYFPVAESRIRYWAAYGFVFTSPNAWKNLLLGAVCVLIPFVGPIVLSGYAIEACMAPLSTLRPVSTDFDFNRFVEYLTRGLSPFLANLIVTAIVIPVSLIGLVAIVVAASMAPSGVMLGAAIGLCVLFWIILGLFMFLILEPLMIRAALLGELGGAFSAAWIEDFIRRMWPEMLLSTMFLFATAIPLALIGYAFCLIGMYPAMALIVIAQWHLYFQLYRLYLARGGTPVPMKPPAC